MILRKVIILNDFWGPTKGGISAFNTDFCMALGDLCNGQLKIICLVETATAEDFQDARKHKVHLIEVDPHDGELVSLSADLAVSALESENIGLAPEDWWVGHDIITGDVACDAAEITNSHSAIVRHMLYEHYYRMTSNDPEGTNIRHDRQRTLFQRCDQPFAVGPLMQEETRKFYPVDDKRNVFRLVPGLASIEDRHRASTSFKAIVFGRMNARADPMKQGRLAGAAFAQAAERIRSITDRPIVPALQIYGLSDDVQKNQMEIADLERAIQDQAGRWFTVVPSRFTNDRKALLNDLAESHVCLMLSLHEGFGLVGWEAIAAGVPLVTSRNSGLYLLLHELNLGEKVSHIEFRRDVGPGLNSSENSLAEDGAVGASLDGDDIAAVANEIVKLFIDRDRRYDQAKALRDELLTTHGFTWEATAREFLRGCDIVLNEVPNAESSRHTILDQEIVEKRVELTAKCLDTRTSFSRMSFNLGSVWGIDRGGIIGILNGGVVAEVVDVLNRSEVELQHALQEVDTGLQFQQNTWVAHEISTLAARSDPLISLENNVVVQLSIRNLGPRELERFCRKMFPKEGFGVDFRRIIFLLSEDASTLKAALQSVLGANVKIDHFELVSEPSSRFSLIGLDELPILKEDYHSVSSLAERLRLNHENSDDATSEEWMDLAQNVDERPEWCALAVAYCRIIYMDSNDSELAETATQWLQSYLSPLILGGENQNWLDERWVHLPTLWKMCASESAADIQLLFQENGIDFSRFHPYFLQDLLSTGVIGHYSTELIDLLDKSGGKLWWCLTSLELDRAWLAKYLKNFESAPAQRAILGLVTKAEREELLKNSLNLEFIIAARRNRILR